MRITASELTDDAKTKLASLGRVQRSAENRPSTDVIANDGEGPHQLLRSYFLHRF